MSVTVTHKTRQRLESTARHATSSTVTAMDDLIKAINTREEAAATLNKADEDLRRAQRALDTEMSSLVELCALAEIDHVGKTTPWIMQQLGLIKTPGTYKDQTDDQRRRNAAVDRVIHDLIRQPEGGETES